MDFKPRLSSTDTETGEPVELEQNSLGQWVEVDWFDRLTIKQKLVVYGYLIACAAFLIGLGLAVRWVFGFISDV